MKFLDLFAGIGGFRRGMELAGHHCIGFCEYDKYAVMSYTAMHLATDNQLQNLQNLPIKSKQDEILKAEYRRNDWYAKDINLVSGDNIPYADCWCFGAPCFLAGTLITTKNRGNIPIESVVYGDIVLTHKNRWRPVIGTTCTLKRGIYELQVHNCPTTFVTGNHRFYVKDSLESSPYWKPVEDFRGRELIQIPNISGNDSYECIEYCIYHDIVEPVYNLEVYDDHSYTANYMGVHNCQDFSIAGKQLGLTHGERSSRIRQVFRILSELKKSDRPEWLIYENVKGMLSSNNGWDFYEILNTLDELGYDAEWQDINSSWFVPQNRERVYVIGHNRSYGRKQIFPIEGSDGKNSVKRICDLYDTKAQGGRIYSEYGISPTLGHGHAMQTPYVAKFCDLSFNNDSLVLTDSARSLLSRYYKGISNRGAENSGVCIPIMTPDMVSKSPNGRRYKKSGDDMYTLTSIMPHGVMLEVVNTDEHLPGMYVEFKNGEKAYAIWNDEYKCYMVIRRLTPKECFRLQGWTDDYFEKAKLVNSDTQLYKQAGNGVTVPCVYEIARRLY